MELPLKYPCGPDNRGSLEDIGWMVKEKATLYRQRVVSHEIVDEAPEAEPLAAPLFSFSHNELPFSKSFIN
jgi:hypothetical protein